MPEYLVATVAAAILGWGGFTWRRAEGAMKAAQNATDQVDRVELKMAENYLTRKEFELSIDRVFSTLERVEKKVDFILGGRNRISAQIQNSLDMDV